MTSSVPTGKSRGRQHLRGVRLAFVTLWAIGCSTALPSFDYSREPDPRRVEYIVGVSDVLRINVWKAPDLSVEVNVRPDGTITLPLIGDLPAAGRTPSDLRREIRNKLTAFLRDEKPTIEVIVQTVNSYRFTVAGNVEHPGMFATRHYVSVSEAVALAGGPNRYADLDRVVVIRRADAGTRNVPVSLKGIYSGMHPEMDVTVLSEDRIFVP